MVTLLSECSHVVLGCNLHVAFEPTFMNSLSKKNIDKLLHLKGKSQGTDTLMAYFFR